MNAKEFQRLMDIAISGEINQGEFARKAGITPEHMNRIVRHPEKYKPSVQTLKKISDATNGRISLDSLKKACGYAASEFYEEEPLEGPAVVSDVIEFKKGVMGFCGKAVRFNSIYDILDILKMQYGHANYKYIVEDDDVYAGKGHAGAERKANITVEIAEEGKKYSLGFVMFYCNTENGGVIFSDAAFDLLTLNSMDHMIGSKKLLEISTRPNEDRSKYQTVYIVQRNEP